MAELVQNLKRVFRLSDPPFHNKRCASPLDKAWRNIAFFPSPHCFETGWCPASERIPLAFTECTFQCDPHLLFQLMSRLPNANCHSGQTSVSIVPRHMSYCVCLCSRWFDKGRSPPWSTYEILPGPWNFICLPHS